MPTARPVAAEPWPILVPAQAEARAFVAGTGSYRLVLVLVIEIASVCSQLKSSPRPATDSYPAYAAARCSST